MQVNPNMPRVHGETFVHVSQVQYFVPCNDPLIEIPRPVISDVEMALGKNCADLIEDGSTLQLGIGSLPDAICKFLQEKNDLGIHSEMISDGVMELIEAGVVNNRKKTLHRGKTVAAFAMGTRKLYDFINEHPSFYAEGMARMLTTLPHCPEQQDDIDQLLRGDRFLWAGGV